MNNDKRDFEIPLIFCIIKAWKKIKKTYLTLSFGNLA